MNPIRWSVRASEDLTRLFEWIAADNPKAAARQVELIAQAIEQLGRFPNSGRPSRMHSVRELVVPNTPYLVRYRLIDETVVLIAIKHGAQRA